MERAFRKRELEDAFYILFGEKSRWRWPFFEDDLLTTGLNIFFAGIIASLVIGLVLNLNVSIPIGAAVAVVWGIFHDNWDYLKEAQKRKMYEKKYLRYVVNTDSYQLLEEALDQRRRGIIPGYNTRKESTEVLMRLWFTAFAEVEKLKTLNPQLLAITSDPAVNVPIAEQIQLYLGQRQDAFHELDQ